MGFSLQYVASQVIKEDGESITHQYLSDLENDRRNPPPDHLIKQLAKVLKIREQLLYVKARRLPPSLDTDSVQQAEAIAQAIIELEDTLAA